MTKLDQKMTAVISLSFLTVFAGLPVFAQNTANPQGTPEGLIEIDVTATVENLMTGEVTLYEGPVKQVEGMIADYIEKEGKETISEFAGEPGFKWTLDDLDRTNRVIDRLGEQFTERIEADKQMMMESLGTNSTSPSENMTSAALPLGAESCVSHCVTFMWFKICYERCETP
jgi:hypothetical protein